MVSLLPQSPDELQFWDAFCGGGGTAAGASQIPDVRITLAMNHDEIAIKSHKANFPNAIHRRLDITKMRVRRYLKRTKPMMLWSSPECKYQGYSSGTKNHSRVEQLSLFEDDVVNPAHEQSRTTMWQVVRMAQEAQEDGYAIPYLPTENVPEVVLWRKFGEWEEELAKLDYRLQYVNINARFLGVPQSRDRIFIVASHKRYPKPDFTFMSIAECDCCGIVQSRQTWKKQGMKGGRYGAQYFYSCPHCLKEVVPPSPSAASLIDWSNLGTRIGDRKKPLEQNTIDRIKQGLIKYVLPGLRNPFMVELRGKSTARPINLPLSTVSTSGAHHQLLVPPGFTMQYYSRNNATSAIDDPLPTVPTDNRHALVTAPFLMSYYTNGNVYSPYEPLRTVPCNDRFALIQPQLDAVDPGDFDLDAIVQDCYTRMLSVSELMQAQGFPPDYILLGNDKEKKRQIGNAVPPAMAQFITSRIRDAVAA